MKEHLISCPLCNGEIPFNSAQCSYCGVLLAPGPSRGTPILKGMICHKCGARSYNYDFCDQCERPFVKICPNCSNEMGLKEASCPSCGLSVRKFTPTRQRREASETAPASWWHTLPLIYVVPVAVAIVLALVALGYFLLRDKPTGQAELHRPGTVKPIDATGDGSIDRYDVYGESNMVVERRFDANHDSKIERVEYLTTQGRVYYARQDSQGDGLLDQIQVYNDEGLVRASYFYANAAAVFPAKIDFHNARGKVTQTWIDANGDAAWERYQQFDAAGRLMLEGTDTQKKGFLDLYLVYRGNQKIVQRLYDQDGDGVVERRESLNKEGVRVVLEEDEDADGLFDKKTLFSGSGRLKLEQFDTDADNVYDSFKSYTMDGQLARTGTDTDGDGSPDEWK